MSLQFIFGNSGSGKSRYLYERVIKSACENPERNYIVLVPEQFTMQTQKELVRLHPRHGIMNIDVLSFGRLAHRIFEEVGGSRRTVLDDIGKSLILRKAAGDVEGELKVLGGNIRRLGYISEVKSLLSEFTQYDIGTEEIARVMESGEVSRQLYWKLHDIKKLQETFDGYLQGKYITGEELLDVLSAVVQQSEILKDSVVVLDGFTGFTPVQNRLLGQLLNICRKVAVTVTIDRREDPYQLKHKYQLFALSKQMVTGLMKIAGEQRAEVENPILLYGKNGEVPFRFRENPPLAFLEQNIFRYTKHVYGKEQEALSLHTVKNPKEESLFIASEILRLVRTKGYRYRDFAVIVSDMGTYAEYMEKAFQTYHIPFFMDHKRSVLLNSFVEYLRSLLAMVDENFSYESTFRFLRTDLTGFTREEVDDVENYVVALGVRGYRKWNEMWVRQSPHASAEDMLRWNGFRQRFVEKVGQLSEVLKRRKKTVREVTEAICEFLMAEELQQKVKGYELQFQERGELVLAKEYAQIYRIVMELFDKFTELLGEEMISLAEYRELLDAGLQEAKVGVIPPGIDQVVIGDMERTRLQDVKVLFLAGVNDTWLPGRQGAAGLLSEYDREAFQEQKISLAPGAKEQAYIQKFYLYLHLTKPSERLYLTFSKVSSDGKSLRPAYLIADVRRMYPALSVQEEDERALWEKELTPETAISDLVQGLKTRSETFGGAWKELYTWYYKHPEWHQKIEQLLAANHLKRPHDRLSEEMARKLYGTILENSVTRLEKFSACAYAHFLTYGMKLEERAVYGFQPVDLGNIFHSAMEQFSKKLEEHGVTWTTVSEELREQLIEESVEAGVTNYGNAVLYSSARNEYVITRMKRLLRRTVWALTKQLEKGDFVPAGYEISFGNMAHLESVNLSLSEHAKMRLRGKIDRVDLYEDEEHVYVKVIDYKTGAKAFQLGEMYHGLQLQLIVYLNAVMEMEEQKHPEKEIIPAGIFYYQMKDPLVEKEKREQLGEQALLKELKPDGVVNASEEVIAHLDRSFAGNSNVIPVGRNKDQSLSRTSKVLSGSGFSTLSEYTDKILNRIGQRILEGEAEIRPYELGQKTGCDYCPYRGICGFDKKIPGYAYRKISKLKDVEALRLMEEELEKYRESGNHKRNKR